MDRLRHLALFSFGLVFVLASAGCGSDANIAERARCDGELNSTEQSVDDAFDADGDGYFDADNADWRLVGP